MANLEKGRIVMSGMGGFLNPPGHPEHTQSVEIDLQCRPENRGGMSLSAAVDCQYLDAGTRAAVRTVLAQWEKTKLPLSDPTVQEWILKVLGYFRGCYRGDGPEPECWHAGNLKIGAKAIGCSVENHAGVHLIRKYYPEYVPTDGQFDNAYWGTKPL